MPRVLKLFIKMSMISCVKFFKIFCHSGNLEKVYIPLILETRKKDLCWMKFGVNPKRSEE